MADRRRGNGAGPTPLDANTPNLNLVLPEVGASNSTWGNKLNSNFAILDNSLQNTGGTVSGYLTVTGGMTLGGNGVSYTGTSGNHMSFGWNGYVNLYVDGNYEGDVATTGYVSGNYLGLGGGQQIGGSLQVDGLLSLFGGANVDSGALTCYGGIVVAGSDITAYQNVNVSGTCSAGTLSASGNADISGDVFGANLITGGGVFGANIEASVQGYKPGGGLWADSSDERLKRDIHDYKTGLRAVCALRPVTYRFNGLGGTTDDDRVHTGLIAQEAELVMPELVSSYKRQLRPGDPYDEDILMLDPTSLFYALVNACRELSAAVERLEKQHITLLGRIRTLENRL